MGEAPADGEDTQINQVNERYGEASDGNVDLSEGDLLGYMPTPVDQSIQGVYRDWFNVNHSSHINRGS